MICVKTFLIIRGDNMQEIMSNPFTNKGTAFTIAEREKYGLIGRLPSKVESIDQQSQRLYASLSKLNDAYLKNQFLMELYEENQILFYYLVGQHVTDLLPILYTPTVADAIMNFSEDFKRPRGTAFINVNEPENISRSLKNASQHLEEVKLMVITDGEGILGIGDWGIQGAWITVGKLAVYTIASGIDPRCVLPVAIDAGTDRQELLDNPHYLGLKQHRMKGEEYYKFIDEFVKQASDLFPNVLFHWEDFGTNHAQDILDKYRYEITTFNDDIQGTGIMMQSAIEAVCKITDIPLKDHKILVFGAGAAGCGIADQLMTELFLNGIPREESKENVYLFDSQGLVLENHPHLNPAKARYARPMDEFDHPITDLAEAIDLIQPSILIGSSGQPGKFTKEIVEKMCQYHERPAIMPISNPTHLNEAQAAEVIEWSQGKALCVTGSPSEPVEFDGITYTIGQANNALLYPGLGLGIVICQAKHVTDRMLSAAAKAIMSLQNLQVTGAGLLPHVSKLREASKLVAAAVIRAAIEDNMARVEIDDIEKAVEDAIWVPDY